MNLVLGHPTSSSTCIPPQSKYRCAGLSVGHFGTYAVERPLLPRTNNALSLTRPSPVRLADEDVVKVLSQSAPKPPGEQDVRLQYLDAHLVVVEKPAGVTSTRHAEERTWPQRRRQLRPTLEEMLPLIIAKVDPSVRRRRGVPPPVRAVHRLDRETSGLMVFARTVTAERGLMQQFKRHRGGWCRIDHLRTRQELRFNLSKTSV